MGLGVAGSCLGVAGVRGDGGVPGKEADAW
jgi:hypothetical protein